MTCGIYKIINKVNSKYYIGSSKNIENRWNIHQSKLTNNKHCNPHLQYAWNKYGKSCFYLEIIETTLNSIRLLREQYYLDLLKPYDDNIGINYPPPKRKWVCD